MIHLIGQLDRLEVRWEEIEDDLESRIEDLSQIYGHPDLKEKVKYLKQILSSLLIIRKRFLLLSLFCWLLALD